MGCASCVIFSEGALPNTVISFQVPSKLVGLGKWASFPKDYCGLHGRGACVFWGLGFVTGVDGSIGLKMFALTVVGIATMMSLHKLPTRTRCKLDSTFCCLFTTVIFLVPASLMTTRLTTVFRSGRNNIFQ